jgi:penicillin-binding protein 1C
VLDNATGDVLAWVGSPDFWAAKDGQTDMVTSPRQPGSALKPFLYALALDRGFTAATVLPDVPKTYATTTGPYSPRNYDRQFHGPVRMREALASSYNVPAIEVASRVGTGSLLNELHLAGFTSLDHDAEYYGLGLALGNGDVSLIELANAYRGLANGGEWRPWIATAVIPSAPAVIPSVARDLQLRNASHRFTSRMSAAIILDILSDPVARMPGFGDVTPFDFPFPTAVKTGTSRHFTDNWAVATTGTFTVAVWAGNFDGHPMQGVSGVTGAGPLLHRIVMITASRFGAGALPTPQNVGARAEPVCRLSGMRATPDCEQLTEWFAPGTEPRAYDTWQSAGGVTLPSEYAGWSGSAKLVTTSRALATRTPAHDTSTFAIMSPRDGDRYAMPVGVDPRYATIALRSTAPRVRWRVDGQPYTRERWPLSPGSHEIVAVTARGDSASARIVVER